MARPEAALITGVFGSGKSTILAEAADLLEGGGQAFAAIDVDWLGWAMSARDVSSVGAPAVGPHAAFDDLTLENLALVVGNDRRHGIERFLLAHAVWRPTELAELQAALDMPLRVIGLVVPLPEIQARLAGDPTRARLDDLARTEAWLAGDREAVPVELTLDNTRPVAEVARQLVDWLGWLE